MTTTATEIDGVSTRTRETLVASSRERYWRSNLRIMAALLLLWAFASFGCGVIDPGASEKQRLLVGRAVIGLAVVIAGLFGIYPPGFVSQVVAFAFGLAAASLFPVLVLGIFSKRVGTVPAVAGMIVGIGFTSFYIIASVYGGMEPWTFGVLEQGVNAQGIGVIGMLANFGVTLALAPLFEGPSEKAQAMVESVREPEGFGPAVRIEEAMEH